MRILLFDELKKIVPLSRTTVWRLERAGAFPRRIQMGSRVGWVEDEVREWLANRPRR